MKKKQSVSLKETIYTGIILDFLFLVFSSLIMDCGTTFMIVFIVVIAHWTGNVAILLSQKGRQSIIGKDFVRFGILPLVILTMAVRGFLAVLGIGF